MRLSYLIMGIPVLARLHIYIKTGPVEMYTFSSVLFSVYINKTSKLQSYSFHSGLLIPKGPMVFHHICSVCLAPGQLV